MKRFSTAAGRAGLDGPGHAAYHAGMYELTVRVDKSLSGRSVRAAALGRLQVSYGQLKRIKFSGGQILVDGCPRRSDYLLREGETLTLRFPRDEGPSLWPSEEPLSLAYEDADYLIADKPAPLPSVASRQGGETLENRVFSYLCCPENFIYRPVNRLDKGTSGLMLVAKNAHAQQLAQSLLHTDAFVREYLAVVKGRLPETEGCIDLAIGHGPGIRRVIDRAGQSALTEYRVLREGGGCSLVGLRLRTGRTHQIRVHMAALGCPVLGDFLYGEEDPRLPGRFALHSARLFLRHPLSGRPVEALSPLPEKLQELMM